jgi:hypothetical protein
MIWILVLKKLLIAFHVRTTNTKCTSSMGVNLCVALLKGFKIAVIKNDSGWEELYKVKDLNSVTFMFTTSRTSWLEAKE